MNAAAWDGFLDTVVAIMKNVQDKAARKSIDLEQQLDALKLRVDTMERAWRLLQLDPDQHARDEEHPQ